MSLSINLISYYKLDSNSNDSVGSNNGTDTAITYNAGNGKIVQGAGLNGTTSKIVIPDTSSLKITGNFSVSAWVKTTSLDAVFYQCYSGNSNVAGYRLEVNNVGGVGKATILSGKNTGTTNGTDYKFVQGNITISDGNWHFLVGVYDGTKLYIYVDGILDASAAWTNNPAFAVTNYIRIGCRNATGTDDFFVNGAEDEIGIWSRALSANEVSQLWNGGKGSQYSFIDIGIAFDNSTFNSVTGTSNTFSHTCSGTNRILFVGVNQQDTAGTYSITGVTYNGVAMTQIGSTQATTNPYQTTLWYLINPSSGANNVVISASSSRAIQACALSYTGAKQTAQPDSFAGGAFTSSTITQSTTTVTNNSWLVGAWVGSRTPSAGTGTTNRQSSGGNIFVDSNSSITPPGSVSLQITQVDNTSSAFIIASFAPFGSNNSNFLLFF